MYSLRIAFLHPHPSLPYKIFGIVSVCTLTLEGSGYAHVEEVQCHTPDGRLDRHIVVVEDNETYFTSAIPLLGQSIIPKGNTKFPFEYSLPTSNLPCSIETPNGNVSYRVAVHAKSPENVNDDYPEKDLRSSIHFIVGPLLDLNRYPRLADFTTITHFEEVQIIAGKCCSCSDSNYVKVHIIVPKRVFIPGELVRFGMQIQNSSERDLECGTMQLVLAINCISRGRRADAEHILAEIKGPAVNARCTQNWEVDNLMIPATGPLGLPPTGLGGGCNVVDADYGLKVSACIVWVL